MKDVNRIGKGALKSSELGTKCKINTRRLQCQGDAAGTRMPPTSRPDESS